MNNLSKFFGQFSVFSERLLVVLDENFSRVAVDRQPVAITADYTWQENSRVDSVQANATAGAIVVYVPKPVGNLRYRIIKTDSSANTVTVNGNGSLINGAATYVLATQYDKCDLEPTGTGWLIVN